MSEENKLSLESLLHQYASIKNTSRKPPTENVDGLFQKLVEKALDTIEGQEEFTYNTLASDSNLNRLWDVLQPQFKNEIDFPNDIAEEFIVLLYVLNQRMVGNGNLSSNNTKRLSELRPNLNIEQYIKAASPSKVNDQIKQTEESVNYNEPNEVSSYLENSLEENINHFTALNGAGVTPENNHKDLCQVLTSQALKRIEDNGGLTDDLLRDDNNLYNLHGFLGQRYRTTIDRPEDPKADFLNLLEHLNNVGLGNENRDLAYQNSLTFSRLRGLIEGENEQATPTETQSETYDPTRKTFAENLGAFKRLNPKGQQPTNNPHGLFQELTRQVLEAENSYILQTMKQKLIAEFHDAIAQRFVIKAEDYQGDPLLKKLSLLEKFNETEPQDIDMKADSSFSKLQLENTTNINGRIYNRKRELREQTRQQEVTPVKGKEFNFFKWIKELRDKIFLKPDYEYDSEDEVIPVSTERNLPEADSEESLTHTLEPEIELETKQPTTQTIINKPERGNFYEVDGINFLNDRSEAEGSSKKFPFGPAVGVVGGGLAATAGVKLAANRLATPITKPSVAQPSNSAITPEPNISESAANVATELTPDLAMPQSSQEAVGNLQRYFEKILPKNGLQSQEQLDAAKEGVAEAADIIKNLQIHQNLGGAGLFEKAQSVDYWKGRAWLETAGVKNLDEIDAMTQDEVITLATREMNNIAQETVEGVRKASDAMQKVGFDVGYDAALANQRNGELFDLIDKTTQYNSGEVGADITKTFQESLPEVLAGHAEKLGLKASLDTMPASMATINPAATVGHIKNILPSSVVEFGEKAVAGMKTSIGQHIADNYQKFNALAVVSDLFVAHSVYETGKNLHAAVVKGDTSKIKEQPFKAASHAAKAGFGLTKILAGTTQFGAAISPMATPVVLGITAAQATHFVLQDKNMEATGIEAADLRKSYTSAKEAFEQKLSASKEIGTDKLYIKDRVGLVAQELNTLRVEGIHQVTKAAVTQKHKTVDAFTESAQQLQEVGENVKTVAADFSNAVVSNAKGSLVAVMDTADNLKEGTRDNMSKVSQFFTNLVRNKEALELSQR